MKSLNYKTYVKGFELEALVALFTHIEQQQDVYKVLFTSPNLQQFNQQLLDFFQQKIKKHTEKLAMFDFVGASSYTNEDILRVIDHLNNKKTPIATMVTQVYPLSEIQTA